jgi:hypothetical protein
MALTVKVRGREFLLTIEEDAQIWCKELGLSGPNAEHVKEQIKEHVNKEEAAPKIAILTRGAHHRNERQKFYPGYARDVPADRHGYRWVSWQETPNGPFRRRKVYAQDVWLDTPENRVALKQIAKIDERMDALLDEIKGIESQLTRLGQVEE